MLAPGQASRCLMVSLWARERDSLTHFELETHMSHFRTTALNLLGPDPTSQSLQSLEKIWWLPCKSPSVPAKSQPPMHRSRETWHSLPVVTEVLVEKLIKNEFLIL